MLENSEIIILKKNYMLSNTRFHLYMGTFAVLATGQTEKEL